MQNQYEKDSSVDFAWNVKNVKGRKNDMGKKSKGKRNLFIAVVIAIVFWELYPLLYQVPQCIIFWRNILNRLQNQEQM